MLQTHRLQIHIVITEFKYEQIMQYLQVLCKF